MKYKLIAAVCLVGVTAVTVLGFSSLLDEEKAPRYHQHMERRGYTACTDHGEETFCTHLPLIEIDTGDEEIPGKPSGAQDIFNEDTYTTTEDGEDMIRASVSVFDSESGNNHLTDTPTMSISSKIRVRGYSSRTFEKAPYLLKFVNDDGTDLDLPILGMDAHHEWVLHGPYLDKSLVRNYMWYNIAGEIMDYAPNVRFCELVVNGDYRGIYLLVESIDNGDDCRLNLSVTEKGQTLTGYLLRLDRPMEEDLDTLRNIYSFTERTNILANDVSIRYPGKDKLTKEIADAIEKDFARYEKAMYSYDYDSKKYGYRSYIDVDSFVDYYIINEFTKNLDAGKYSTYIYLQPGEKYKLCVWDFNNACNNYVTNDINTTGIKDIDGITGFSMHVKVFFVMLMRDKDFVDAVIDRYEELRTTYLSDDYLEKYIQDTVDYLGPAIDRNSERWMDYIVSDQLQPAERNVHSQKEAVEKLADWLRDRGQWLDNNINSLYQYCADSKNKKYNEEPN